MERSEVNMKDEKRARNRSATLTSRARSSRGAMNLPKALMTGVVALLLTASALSQEANMNYKLYEYEGEKFEVFEPQEGRIAVKGKGLTAYITINEATSMYREELDGWGTDQNTLDGALNRACRRILDKSKKPSEDTLLKGLHDFYETLK